jgi:hypothetical protein
MTGRNLSFLLFSGFIATMFAGCGPMPRSGNSVELLYGTTEARKADYGEFTSTCHVGQIVRLHASFSWDIKEGVGALHSVRWELSRAGKLLEQRTGNWFFNSNPCALMQSFDSTVFGPGKYVCNLTVDGKALKTYEFEILQ